MLVYITQNTLLYALYVETLKGIQNSVVKQRKYIVMGTDVINMLSSLLYTETLVLVKNVRSLAD